MTRKGPSTFKDPPKMRTIARNADVIKIIARYSPKGDGNVKHDELRRCFASVLESRASSSYFKQNVRHTADMLSN
eukprot:5570026-Pyramimonas_sp.AAC.1